MVIEYYFHHNKITYSLQIVTKFEFALENKRHPHKGCRLLSMHYFTCAPFSSDWSTVANFNIPLDFPARIIP